MPYLIQIYKAIVATTLISLMFDVVASDGGSEEVKAVLHLTNEQTEQVMMGKEVVTGYSLSTNKVNYSSSKIKARLNLSDKQAEQFEPIFLGHIEKRLGVMEKHGINRDFRSFGKKMGLRQLRAVKRDMEKINKQTENELAGVLSKEQLDEYKKIQEELRIEMRARLKNSDTRKK